MPTSCFLPFTDVIHSIFGALRREVIQHDTVRDIGGKRLVNLLHITHFYLDTKRLVMGLAVLFSTHKRILDTTGKVHMIIFKQDHVE